MLMGSVESFKDHHTAATITLHTTLPKWIFLFIKKMIFKHYDFIVNFFLWQGQKVDFTPSKKGKAPNCSELFRS
jgi:hypothetical protein